MKNENITNINNYEKEIGYNSRFSGEIGKEYRLFKESVPWHDEFQNTIKTALSKYTNLYPNKKEFKVLEAGTGTGYTTIRILDADPRIRVIAIDNEEETLKQAKEILNDKSDRIEFKRTDILSELQNLPDESIDSFTSAYLLHNIPHDDRKKIFKEIYRVLKKEGIFINADKIARDDEEKHKQDLENQIKAFDIYDKMGMPNIKEEWTEHYYEDEANKITEGELKNILRELGFSNVNRIFRKGMEATIIANKFR